MQPTRNIHSYPDTAGRGRPLHSAFRFPIALLSAGFAGMGLLPAAAQVAATAPQTTAASPDAIKQREQELEAARAQQKSAAEAQAKLKADIAAIGQDRSKLNQQLIDIAAQVRGVETRIGDAEARLRPLDAREQQIRGSLDSRRSEIVEVLAALQRAGRRTPPALLVRPEDALQSLRTAMLLGSVVPELRARAEKLAGDLSELVALRKTIATERDRLARRSRQAQGRPDPARRPGRRTAAQAERDRKGHGGGRRARHRAVQAGRQPAGPDRQDGAGPEERREGGRDRQPAGGARPRLNGKPNLGALKDPARLSPAIAFASAKGLFALPVNGVKIRDFGGSDGAGGVEKGISLATRAGAQVTTPCDGWVVYAGPFRSYGQLLILNAGGGYHVLIAGMERISVNIGQFVLTGEPVATMGTTSQVASILATNASQPVLYVEFRKDGTPIDPGPWWAANEGEKVRG